MQDGQIYNDFKYMDYTKKHDPKKNKAATSALLPLDSMPEQASTVTFENGSSITTINPVNTWEGFIYDSDTNDLITKCDALSESYFNITTDEKAERFLNALEESKRFKLVEQHMKICKNFNDTYKAKNADYGDSFHRVWESAGIISAYTRLADKFYRLENLILKAKDSKVKDESIKDTLMDMANYCIMSVMELEREKTEEAGGV